MPRSVRLALAAVVYAAIVALVFATLWARPGSDDYAGWAPAIAALALPACVVVARARDRLGLAGALTLAIPAGLALGAVALTLFFFTVSVLAVKSDVTGLLGLFVLGPGVAIAMMVVVCRRSFGQPVRDGARRVVAVVAASGAAALLATSRGWWGFWRLEHLDLAIAAAFFLLGALPLGWSLGPALVLLATREPR